MTHVFRPGDTFLGYTIERLLGEGGLGSVWLARHGMLDTLYAVKVLDRGVAKAKTEWQSHGHQDELYRVPAQKRPKGFRQPKLFKGQVVFVMGKRTYSSAGILLTLARDNHIGTIIGTTSTFSPSHYGEILPYRLPNTGVLGSIPCKYFVRPDAATADAPCLEPDIAIDLDDKDASWRFICESFGSQL